MLRRILAVTWSLLVILSSPSDAFTQGTRNSIPHLEPVHHGQLEVLAARAGEALFRVRSVTPPQAGFSGAMVESDGIAVLMSIDDEEPNLITSFGYLAGASSVEVWVESEWVEAELFNGTSLFNLAMLSVETSLPVDVALPLVDAWPIGASVYVPLATNGSSEEPEIVVGGLGGFMPGDLSYYVRAHFWQRNGYPVLSANGEVIALTSRFAPDGRGVLAIPFEHIRTWRQESETLDPFAWRPEVRVETIEPRVNEEAFEIRTQRVND